MFLGRIALICALGVMTTPAVAGAEFQSRFEWDRPEGHFGGLSGLDLSPDGTRFHMIGDSGIVLTGHILRTYGRVTGIVPDTTWIDGLRTPEGAHLGKVQSDAEGLAVTDDGTAFVSFEDDHRVWSYDEPAGPATVLPALPEDLYLERNGGLEALAIAPDGALWAVAERPPWGWAEVPVLRLDRTRWRVVDRLPRHRVFWPVGADFDEEGRLWLLERGLRPGGFLTRVRRFDAGPGGLGAETVILETTPGTHGNLEGIAVWRDDTGARMVTLIADDNYLRFQVTEIVEYRILE